MRQKVCWWGQEPVVGRQEIGFRSQDSGARRQVLGVGVLGFWGFSSISPLPHLPNS
ncbi:unknown protein [Microcystis aeruginosa NIES-843]|uniref:Uncharacterized protein n=1 Tax=Microcystis aeruginosa (strain NIES-843 / IAM M-2473) TaxID=449447 RepID=B0JG95_MICAN|nr:unknown protein [Microcystis aeruginosa NIES-843]